MMYQRCILESSLRKKPLIVSTKNYFSQITIYLAVLLVSTGMKPMMSYALQYNRKIGETSWYTRYPYYPPYCATPDEMAKRKIPPLQNDKRLGETRLRHVTAVLRHGSRTPYAAGLNCWDGYDTNPETSIWDCNLTAYLSPPPPSDISREEGNNNNHDEAMFLFEKRYDALHDIKKNLNNHLRGTCQLGQLLLQGYEQEYTNGQFLRDAYVYDETAYNHDARMRLLDVSSMKTQGTNVWDDIYYRVDDESRTLLSGQVVLRGLFGPELDTYFDTKNSYPIIPLHTADYDRDILVANHEVCPRLSEIWERNVESPEFQQFNSSNEALLIRQFQGSVLKLPNPDRDMDAIDCIMTTMCTDRPLPEAINDYHPPDLVPEKKIASNWSKTYGPDMLQRLHDFNAQMYVQSVKANEAEYAKLAMQPLWYEIMMKVYPHIQGQTNGLNKLALFSGHDTTIIPLLASLGVWNDTAWPPYASMVIIELHEMNVDGNTNKKIFHSNYAFRLLYNGVVITSQVESCEPDLDLCDANVLVDYLLQEHNCARQYSDTIPYKDAVTRTKEIVSTHDGMLYFLLVVGISAGFGGSIVYIYLVKCFPKQYYNRAPDDEEDISVNGNVGGYRDRNDEYRTESPGTPITEIS
jgi:Histidine phosphatase superfamily (branch 2)